MITKIIVTFQKRITFNTFLMLALLRRTFWPPSMVYISIIITHYIMNYISSWYGPLWAVFHVLHKHLSFRLVGTPHGCWTSVTYVILNLIHSINVSLWTVHPVEEPSSFYFLFIFPLWLVIKGSGIYHLIGLTTRKQF